MAFANISRMSISRRQSKMSAASERRLRSDVCSCGYTFLLIKFSHPSLAPTFPPYTHCQRTERRSRHTKKEERTMKESMLTVEGKRDEREYGVNYRMHAVSFSGSSPFHIFSAMVFMSLEVLHYMRLF